VENDRLYGRLFRLLYCPIIEALSRNDDAAVLDFLRSFRYALAGEFATTGRLARSLRLQRSWGLEVGTLGETFRLVGFDGVAQVDLGVHEHDHRSVSGPSGLSEMSRQVTAALLRAVEENGGEPKYETLEERYLTAAERHIDAYALDSAFNGLEYDRRGEREQIDSYADAIEPPGPDTRLPPWESAPLAPGEVVDAASDDLEDVMRIRVAEVDPNDRPER
jgi:glucosyl-3-phosphoglycerate synthase